MRIQPIFESDPALEALQSVGLLPSPQETKTKLEVSLARAGLTLDCAIQELCELALNGTKDEIKLRAIQDVLKLHGVMKDQDNKIIPEVHINIQNGEGSVISILTPR